MNAREKLRALVVQLVKLEGEIKTAAVEFENTVEDSAGVQNLMFALLALGEARETLQDHFGNVELSQEVSDAAIRRALADGPDFLRDASAEELEKAGLKNARRILGGKGA